MGHFNVDSSKALLIHVMSQDLPQEELSFSSKGFTFALPMENVHTTVAYKFILIVFTV